MTINDGHVTEVNGGSLWPYHVVSLDIAISRYGACVEDVMWLAHACVEDVHFISRRCIVSWARDIANWSVVSA